jgi:NADPH-dependent 2,4-dienoyl-CoA reductase/sulfur reductase-like enzyme
MSWDLVIVGGGTTGLTAATFAGRRGLRVLVIEAAPHLGGVVVGRPRRRASSRRINQQAQKGIGRFGRGDITPRL